MYRIFFYNQNVFKIKRNKKQVSIFINIKNEYNSNIIQNYIQEEDAINYYKYMINKYMDLGYMENQETKTSVVNKGTGAGGANTNYYGKKFEEKTNNQIRLLNDGYIKNDLTKKQNYLTKTFEDKMIVFVLQNGLKMYMKNKYNIELFRCPDEAYIIEYNTGRKVIKILEKKEQNVEGSVETKLWSGPSLKREYELVLGDDFEVYYGFCVSDFLKKKLISNEKKYTILNTILDENDIAVLFGDDENYFETFDIWFNNSL